MPLDPDVREYLDAQAASGAPARGEMSVAETRELYLGMRPLAGEAPSLPRVEDRRVPGPEGPVPVRIYAPAASCSLPVLVYFHGGRYFSGDLDTHDPVCRMLAAEAGCLVAAVHYRLAPEHRFPAASEDCYAVTEWVARNAAEVGADPEFVAVGGDSAGGNLAAVTALLARQRGGSRICFQMLIYPMLDATRSLPSHTEYGSGYGPGSEDMERGWREYVPPLTDRRHPQISPLWEADLGGLPPAFVLTAEYDSLRDEGEEYARRLAAAGVPVVLTRYPGVIHGFFQLGGVVGMGREAVSDAARHLRRAFAAVRT